MLDKITQQNASKFAIFWEYENNNVVAFIRHTCPEFYLDQFFDPKHSENRFVELSDCRMHLAWAIS